MKLDFTNTEKNIIGHIQLPMLKKIFVMVPMGLLFCFLVYLEGSYSVTIVNLLLNCFIILCELYILRNIYKALWYIAYIIFAIIFIGCNCFILSMVILNNKIFQYDLIINSIFFFLLIIFVLIGYIFEKYKFKEFIDYFIENKAIDFKNCRVKMPFWGIPKNSYNKLSKWVMKKGSMGLYVLIILNLGIIRILLKVNYPNKNYFDRNIIAGFLALIACYIMSIGIGNLIYRYIYIHKWGKTNNKKVFTEIYDYILLQDQINNNRKLRDLKPLNIKKIYLGKSFYIK